MDKTALVSFDIDNGQRVIDALREHGVDPDVALWAVLPEYEEWRLVIASHYLDQDSKQSGYGSITEATRKAGMRFLTKPDIFLRNMDDPFIQNLRQSFAGGGDVYGMRLGSQKFGGQYVEDAFVYRIH